VSPHRCYILLCLIFSDFSLSLCCSQHTLKVEMDRYRHLPVFEEPEWAGFWEYLGAVAALRGKKMVVSTPGRAPASVPVTPAVAAGESTSSTNVRKGGRNIRLSIASSLGTIDENDHDGANTTYQDDIEEDEPEEPLNDSRRSVERFFDLLFFFIG